MNNSNNNDIQLIKEFVKYQMDFISNKRKENQAMWENSFQDEAGRKPLEVGRKFFNTMNRLKGSAHTLQLLNRFLDTLSPNNDIFNGFYNSLEENTNNSISK